MSEGVKKVNNVLMDISDLKDEDIEATRKMAEKQANYAHPLKTKTAGEHQERGKKNLRIIEKLEELKAEIETNKG